MSVQLVVTTFKIMLRIVRVLLVVLAAVELSTATWVHTPTAIPARRGADLQQHLVGHEKLSWRSTRRLQQVQGPDVCKQSYPHVPFNWRSHSKVLALTFDDGPESKGLPAILDVLRVQGVKAAFFVNTYRQSDWLGPFTAPSNQAAVKRAVSEGHELGSHAAEHLALTNLTAAQIEQQIAWAIANISAATGRSRVPLFRAPYGDGFWTAGKAPNAITQHLWGVVRKSHVHVSWTFSGNDYKLGGNTPGCVEALFNAYGPPVVQQGITGVVLMHSTTNAMGGCPAALHKIIQYWKDAGYTFVTVPQVVEEIYGFQPEAVVQAAQSCPLLAGTGQRFT